MDIAIVGAGVAGSSLYRLISLAQKNNGGRVDLYSIHENQSCGIHPCAWMTHGHTFREMMEILQLPPDRYLIRQFSKLDFDGYPIHCDLATIRKPLLLRDLLGPAPVRYEAVDTNAYDIVVDCTGRSRALLPPSQDDILSPTLQYRVRRISSSPEDPHPRIRFVKAGYAWTFPLDKNHLHIGVGSLWEDLGPCLDRVGFMDGNDIPVCTCRSSVRVGTPGFMLPFHEGNVWGVGESIGTVSPLVGDGIVPSMQCAALFAKDLLEGTLDRYEDHVLTEFSWMEEERDVIDRMIAQNGQLGVRDLLVMRDHATRFGLQVSLRWVLSWMVGRRILGRCA